MHVEKILMNLDNVDYIKFKPAEMAAFMRSEYRKPKRIFFGIFNNPFDSGSKEGYYQIGRYIHFRSEKSILSEGIYFIKDKRVFYKRSMVVKYNSGKKLKHYFDTEDEMIKTMKKFEETKLVSIK